MRAMERKTRRDLRRPVPPMLQIHFPRILQVPYSRAAHGDGMKCPQCQRVDPRPWPNPILETMARLGFYQGPTLGGYQVCAACEPAVAARFAPARPTLETTGVPSEFHDATWQTWDSRPGSGAAAKQAAAWLDRWEGTNLLLVGETGVGKTRLAATCAVETFQQRTTSVSFLRVPQLLRRLRAAECAPDRFASEHDALEQTAAVRLLVLDDIGTEKPTDYAKTALLTLLELRHDAKAPTILTSNLGLDELQTHFAEDRITSRLGGWSLMLTLTGEDERLRRRRKGQRRLEGFQG